VDIDRGGSSPKGASSAPYLWKKPAIAGFFRVYGNARE